MIFISHSGNLAGLNAKLENTPLQIEKVLKQGHDCEIDVLFIDNNYFLGHDEPKYKIPHYNLMHPGLWCHAKNFEALEQMLNDNIHCFWHEGDDYTLTSNGYIWTNTGKTLGENSILVDLNKKTPITNKNIKGVCSDYLI